MRQIPEKYLVNEQDIRSHEGIYVHTPSPFARDHLFYVQLEAFYTCGPLYDVQRKDLDSYLLFFIKEGQLRFEYEGKSFIAGSGDVIFLDCRRPHRYQSIGVTRFYWFHLDGSATKAYFEHFLEGRGIHFSGYQKMEEYFILIHDMMKGGFPDEGMMSVHVHRILALLASAMGNKGLLSDSVSRAKRFMDEHYMEKLSTGEIADVSRMSQSHFFRLFREETGMTPYGYLMNVRMNHAMKMLLETPCSVEEIADYCAFCSSANFIRAFRQSTGTTPHRFRRLMGGFTSSL
ncbi:MAG: helix-turn-helix domain-containing protein [Sarcina sp.]|nr:helix-turn-helix domain-containing protein [Sarcina sp.]